MQKELIIVGGPNGSGKTTFAKSLVVETGYDFLNADEIKAENEISDLAAGKAFFEKLDQLFRKGVNIIMESTLSGKYILGKIQKAKEKGYRITLFYVFLKTAEDCIQRIKIRVKTGGHFVPDEDVRRRFNRSKLNFWNTFKEMANDWTLVYNSIGQGPQRVAFGNSNSYLVESDDLFSTFASELKL